MYLLRGGGKKGGSRDGFGEFAGTVKNLSNRRTLTPNGEKVMQAAAGTRKVLINRGRDSDKFSIRERESPMC